MSTSSVWKVKMSKKCMNYVLSQCDKNISNHQIKSIGNPKYSCLRFNKVQRVQVLHKCIMREGAAIQFANMQYF